MRVADIDVELTRINTEMGMRVETEERERLEVSYEDSYMLRESTVTMFNEHFDPDNTDGAGSRSI